MAKKSRPQLTAADKAAIGKLQGIFDELPVALAVRVKPGLQFFRRADIRFHAKPTIVRVDSLSPQQLLRIVTEEMLHWTVLDEIPEGDLDAVHLTHDELVAENGALKARVAELEERLAELAPDNVIDYGSMNVPDLRDACGHRGISYDGLKRAALIAALEAADKEALAQG